MKNKTITFEEVHFLMSQLSDSDKKKLSTALSFQLGSRESKKVDDTGSVSLAYQEICFLARELEGQVLPSLHVVRKRFPMMYQKLDELAGEYESWKGRVCEGKSFSKAEDRLLRRSALRLFLEAVIENEELTLFTICRRQYQFLPAIAAAFPGYHFQPVVAVALLSSGSWEGSTVGK